MNAFDAFEWGSRTYLMGILNITPDSFSDGGHFIRVESALNRARQMSEEGADFIDIGAESTRPGAMPVDAATEWARLEPFLIALKESGFALPISIDTAKASVAAKAMEVGIRIINDINGLQGDPEMAATIADANAGLIAMHNGRIAAIEGDLIDSIKCFFDETLRVASRFGLGQQQIILDPGFGFGKTFEQNMELLRRLDELHCYALPLLVGTSRKSFIGKLLDLDTDQRVEGTLATTVTGIAKGADIFRVHDVKENVRTARMADALWR